MASIGQVIFWSMIVLIFIVGGLLILILSIAFTRSQSSFVETHDPFPVGNIGEDIVLDCKFQPSTADVKRLDQVTITWEKDGLSGVVYRYQNRAAQLRDQNPQFRGRTRLFTDSIAAGNASLLLWNVGIRDAGMYRCSVSAPSGRGSISLTLRVAAYSSPSFTRKENLLTAEAQRWYPKPDVTWKDHNGDTLNGSASFFNNSAGILRVVTTLEEPVRVDDTYTCLIQNHLVVSVSQATIKA
ncbi:V-set domain-containing T-cell activation inhibitor 1 [Megalops cyprinoides]|uniref:V-set domain-containing T-cell activation inhibitor 1 n=1 Tax=Megalops cyprinoides TaxID=118141 RepID=UPI00186569EC|nr:V-set domain-containing T-cell activation inhibitor 1 [Megalops cyprinoides]